MKLGCPSYVYPADIVSNTEKLSGLVEDIELLIFEGASGSVLPTRDEVSRLLELSREGGFSYTVHLPLDIDVCSDDANFRDFSLLRAEEIVDLTSPLNPRGFVLHLPGGEGECWTDAACFAAERLLRASGGNLFVENLTYPFNRLYPVFERTDALLCLDIGHAQRSGDDWKEIYRRFGDRTGVVHFYMRDPAGSGRHLGLQNASAGFVSDVTGSLLSNGYRGVLTMEVFCEEDFFKSKEIVEREIERWAGK